MTGARMWRRTRLRMERNCPTTIKWYACLLPAGHDGEHKAVDEVGKPWRWVDDEYFLRKGRR